MVGRHHLVHVRQSRGISHRRDLSTRWERKGECYITCLSAVSLTHSLVSFSLSPSFPAAHDLKSIVLNILSLVLFLFPIGCYFYADQIQTMALTVGVCLLIAFVTPPVGFLRPHPYSDMPSNRSKKTT